MGWCERKQIDCECVEEQISCNRENCYRNLPNAFIKPFLCDPTGTGLIAVGNQDLKSNTIEIGGCEHIYLTQSGIDVKFELNNDNLKKFKQLIINGLKFLRAESFCEDLLDNLRKNNKENLKWHDVAQAIYDLLEG